LKVKYISLVNLVADKEVVRELVADTMTVANVRAELDALLNDVAYRENMLREYDRMIEILGPAGASRQAASKMIELLSLRRG
jgi:lipid-A-disaccharide synthase